MRVNKERNKGRKNSRKIKRKTEEKNIEKNTLNEKLSSMELYLEYSAWKNNVRMTKTMFFKRKIFFSQQGKHFLKMHPTNNFILKFLGYLLKLCSVKLNQR